LRDFSLRAPAGVGDAPPGWPETPAGGSTTSGSIACVPYRKRKRPLRGIGVAVGAFCPIRPNVTRALDFAFDQSADGRNLKLLNVIDEYSRECLAIDVERAIDADGVVACLEHLAAQRGAPAYARFDHGPEFIAYAVSDWRDFSGTDTVFIDPGSPWQNAWIESFNDRLRDELLNGQRFDSQVRHPALDDVRAADRRAATRPAMRHFPSDTGIATMAVEGRRRNRKCSLPVGVPFGESPQSWRPVCLVRGSWYSHSQLRLEPTP